MKTVDLIGPALDWAVALAEGHKPVMNPHRFGSIHYGAFESELGYRIKHYSTDWAQGGPIIEREAITAIPYGAASTVPKNPEYWEAVVFEKNESITQYGPTPLIAAMRCYVASKLGNEVDIPEELTK